jgi:hypothetical protein
MVSPKGPDAGDRFLRFQGIPVLDQGSAMLAESRAGEQLPLRPTRLRASLHGVDTGVIDQLMELWICIGDPDSPAVRVSLRELLALGGERPLNLDLPYGVQVWVRLVAPGALWPTQARLYVEVA